MNTTLGVVDSRRKSTRLAARDSRVADIARPELEQEKINRQNLCTMQRSTSTVYFLLVRMYAVRHETATRTLVRQCT